MNLNQKSYDPLQKAKGEAHDFNQSWLKRGEFLTLFQRSGFAILSLFFILWGLFCGRESADEFKEDAFFFGAGFAVAALFFLFFGSLGLSNVLRFPKASSASTDEE